MAKAKSILLARAFAVALLALFALPSCFTVGLWRERHDVVRTEPFAVDVVQTRMAVDEQGKVAGFAVQLGPDAGQLGAAAAGAWLVVSSLRDPPSVTAFLHALRTGQLGDARLGIVLAEPRAVHAEPRDCVLLLRGRLLRAAPVAPRLLSFDGEQCRARCDARVQLAAAPPATGTPWPGAPADFACEGSSESGGRIAGKVLLTPITVALDVVTLPLQLLGALAFTLAD